MPEVFICRQPRRISNLHRILAGAVLLPLALSIGQGAAAPAAPEDSSPVLFPTVIVAATGSGRAPFDLPYATAVLTRAALEQRLPRTLPAALEELPGLMVQKTGTAQGSPYIRGFTGFRTLLLLDGIRLNNSTFREGPNQYWSTVDPFGIDRLEVVKGPGSVMYGSDAVGGTVNAVGRGPESTARRGGVPGRLHHRFASADQSHAGRAEVASQPSDRLAAHAGVTFRRSDDLRAGRGTGTQPKTGYDETALDGRIICRLDANRHVTAFAQQFRQEDAWRTHTTIFGGTWEGTRPGGDLQRSLDQDRRLFAVQYHALQQPGPVEQLHLSVSHQRQAEEQFRLRGDRRREDTGVTVATLGAFAQAQSRSPWGRWVYGGEVYRDRVSSSSVRYRADGVLTAVDIQGPVAGRATYDLAGGYVENRLPRLGSLDLVIGGRVNQAAADAQQVRDPRTGRATALRENWNSVVGGLRGVLHLDAAGRHNLFAGIGEALRAPNLSDLTRFDIAEGGQIETPAPGLKPEYSLTGEFGWRTRQSGWSAEVALFHTKIRNQIIRTPTGARVDGLDEVTKRNSGAGFVHGVEISSAVKFSSEWTLWALGTWMQGELDYYPSADASLLVRGPMSRLMPPTAHVGVRWEPRSGRRWLALSASAAGRQDRLAPNDRVDLERIPVRGTPGYGIVHLRGGWRISPAMTVTAAIENLGDKDHRIHGSGVNEAGRNLVIATDLRF